MKSAAWLRITCVTLLASALVALLAFLSIITTHTPSISSAVNISTTENRSTVVTKRKKAGDDDENNEDDDDKDTGRQGANPETERDTGSGELSAGTEILSQGAVSKSPISASHEKCTGNCKHDVPALASSMQASSPRCYVFNKRPCIQKEGFAGTLRRTEFMIAIASKYNCVYVCNPADWVTGGHRTGNVGSLLGCSSGRVSGNRTLIAPSAGTSKMTIGRSQLIASKSREHVARIKDKKPLLKGKQTVTHETSWKWLQAQYNAVRESEGRKTELWGGAVFRIALQLRRGDRPRECPLFRYLAALRDLFAAIPWITPDNYQMLIIGQLHPKSDEFACLSHLPKTRFLVDRGKRKISEFEKLREDLDYASTSNILILGGGGSFGPAVGMTQQAGGIILHTKTKDGALDGVPHAYKLDKKGRFTCNYKLEGFVARTLNRPAASGPSQPTAATSALLGAVELAIKDYLTWYDKHSKCEKNAAQGRSSRPCDSPDFTKPVLGECGQV